MVHRLPITKARINLGAVAKRAHLSGDYFILEKDGIPIAGHPSRTDKVCAELFHRANSRRIPAI